MAQINENNSECSIKSTFLQFNVIEVVSSKFCAQPNLHLTSNAMKNLHEDITYKNT